MRALVAWTDRQYVRKSYLVDGGWTFGRIVAVGRQRQGPRPTGEVPELIDGLAVRDGDQPGLDIAVRSEVGIRLQSRQKSLRPGVFSRGNRPDDRAADP
ncbi:hypothetical protein GCM10027456_02510 [Kineosporia babensis]